MKLQVWGYCECNAASDRLFITKCAFIIRRGLNKDNRALLQIRENINYQNEFSLKLKQTEMIFGNRSSESQIKLSLLKSGGIGNVVSKFQIPPHLLQGPAFHGIQSR